jgi:methylated-DNA-[protein]-cysteine S-methyltransferase
MSIQISSVDSPIGTLTIATQGPALCALEFEGREQALRKELRRRFPGEPLQEGGPPHPVLERLRAYFAGDLGALQDIPVLLDGGTPFQRAVWSELRRLKPGQTVSYRELAERIGHPKAVRAVGAANGANPVALVLPCHRVIGADGRLTGYGGGLDRKRWLLQHEGAA